MMNNLTETGLGDDYGYSSDIGCSQYSELDLSRQRVVDAVYVAAKDEDDRGNRYVEALPRRRSESEMNEYTREMRYDGFRKESALPISSKIERLMKLRELRFPLPMQDRLEDNMYTAMVKPLRQRYCTDMFEDRECVCRIGDKDISVNGVMISDEREGVDGSFSVIGYPGTGKSSAVRILLDHYPRSILHKCKKGYRIQVPYLFVNCFGHSNIRELFNQMGRALDRALGNFVDGVYENRIRKCRDLGAKTTEIINMIELFNISVLVLDECQTINYNTTTENSIENIVTIVNATKVSVICIGNQEAYEKMNSNVRISRRLGIPLVVHDYCNDKAFFAVLVNWLFGYQWFCTDKKVVPDDKMINALHKCTNGIIAHLVNLYIVMHEENFENPDIAINAAFVRNTSRKYYSHIEKLLKSEQKLDRDDAIHRASMESNERLAKLLIKEKEKEKYASKEIVGSTEIRQKRADLLRNVFDNVSKFGDFSYDAVTRAFNQVAQNGAAMDEALISMKVLDIVRKAKEDNIVLPVSRADALAFVQGDD